RDFQLDVAGGTHVGVMAPQSVCEALAEAIDHGSETVLNGVPASRLNPAQRRRLVLVAPRSPELFDDTARANIVLDSQTTVARLNAVVDAAALD
ncbi:hypothetical protein, partial [Streptococcus pneumoniae]